MSTYVHRVAYYETDRMGITHHSNYIRWMEEARVAFLDEIGWSFVRLEELGITSPLLKVSCDYLHPTTFDDRVEIDLRLTEYSGLRFTFAYEMRKAGERALVCKGSTQHCFLDQTGRPLRVPRAYPDLHELLTSLVSPDSD